MIVVTFKDHVPAELIAEMLSTAFGGLCKSAQAGAGPRSIVLRPTNQELPAVKAQLDEFAKEGALAYSEQAG